MRSLLGIVGGSNRLVLLINDLMDVTRGALERIALSLTLAASQAGYTALYRSAFDQALALVRQPASYAPVHPAQLPKEYAGSGDLLTPVLVSR